MRIAGETILVHDLLDGTTRHRLESLIPRVTFRSTAKNALSECRALRPFLVIVVVPGYFPALEVFHHHMAAGRIPAPMLYLSKRTWIGTVDSSWGLFWPKQEHVVLLENLTGLMLAEKIHDCSRSHRPNH